MWISYLVYSPFLLIPLPVSCSQLTVVELPCFAESPPSLIHKPANLTYMI